MPVSITIHDLPEETVGELSARAASSGRPLEEYVRTQLIELAERPSPNQFWDRVRRRVEATGTRLPADVVLAVLDRDRR
jgi:plasmid stability protein